jgi:hypothetical protein
MRAQAQNNIYVIPAPSVFTFGQAMLFSAACCIPAILSLAAFSYQIKEFHWRNNNEKKTDARADTTIKKADTTTGRLMKRVDVPVFSVVILAILIIGEINFWSIQVSWQTEPIGSVGTSFSPCVSPKANIHRPVVAYCRHYPHYSRISIYLVGGQIRQSGNLRRGQSRHFTHRRFVAR